MSNVCPLCRAGRLEPRARELEYEGRVLATSIHQCTACRESLLSPGELESLRTAIRDAGLGDSPATIDAVVERVLLRPE
jgi:Zn-finger nucleic acid-binding protein